MLNMIDDSPCSARPGKDPARSAAIGSVPIRASGYGNGLVAGRSAKPHAAAKPKPLGGRGTRIILSPVGSRNAGRFPGGPNPCVYLLL